MHTGIPLGDIVLRCAAERDDICSVVFGNRQRHSVRTRRPEGVYDTVRIGPNQCHDVA